MAPTQQIKSNRDTIISDISLVPGYLNRKFKPDEIFDRYVEEFTKLLNESQYARTSLDINYNLFRIPLTKLRSKAGQYTDGVNDYYWSSWFQENARLFEIKKKGSKIKGKKPEMTQIKLTDLALELMFGSAISSEEISLHITEKVINQYSPIEFYNRYYDNLTLNYDKTNFVTTNINMDSLEAYITQTLASKKTAQLSNTPKLNFIKKLNDHLKHAYMIRALAIGYAEHTGNAPALVQASEKSEFGRTYLKGVNLQNCPKLVRHAALGKCYEYDISSSVFAWRNDTVRIIVEKKGIDFIPTHTFEYLDSKDSFRKHIAKIAFPEDFESSDQYKIDNSIKQAKQILTSISFGATAKNNGWYDEHGIYKSSAISTLVRDPVNFENLINDKDFNNFLDEQRIITDIIIKHYTEKGAFKNLGENLTKRLTTKSVKMAYLYQQFESKLIESVILLAHEYDSADNNLEVLLTVHDAIYTNKQLDLMVVSEIQKTRPSFNLDRTIIRGNINKTIESDYDRELREHHERMAEQNRIADLKYREKTKPAVNHEMDEFFKEEITSMEDAIEKEKAEVNAELTALIIQREEESRLRESGQTKLILRKSDETETPEEKALRQKRLEELLARANQQ